MFIAVTSSTDSKLAFAYAALLQLEGTAMQHAYSRYHRGSATGDTALQCLPARPSMLCDCEIVPCSCVRLQHMQGHTGTRHSLLPSAATVNRYVQVCLLPVEALPAASACPAALQPPMWYRNTMLEPSRLNCTNKYPHQGSLEQHDCVATWLLATSRPMTRPRALDQCQLPRRSLRLA